MMTSQKLSWAHFDNGHYQVSLSSVGTGLSQSQGLALNRWHDDPTVDARGVLFYLRDLDSDAVSSLGFQPVCNAHADYAFHHDAASATLTQQWGDLHSEMTLSLLPDSAVEQRVITLHNQGSEHRRLELTSLLEVVLFYGDADAAHPAFAKLFVQTEFDAASQSLLAHRRGRSNEERWPWLVHARLDGNEPLQWESDRARFIGRGRRAANPLALTQQSLSGTVGDVLDPVFSLQTVVELAAGESRQFTFILGVAAAREAAVALVTGLRQAHAELAVLPDEEPQPLAPLNSYFDATDLAYHLELKWQDGALQSPPLPWINVIANRAGGSLVSESGAGYSWFRNSQANRATPWSNDPVSDTPTSAIYLQDSASGSLWSPLPQPLPAPVDYHCRHGFGYSEFSCRTGAWQAVTRFFMAEDLPLRVAYLVLTNCSAATATITLTHYQQLVMGTLPRHPSPIITGMVADREILWAENPQGGAFAGKQLFTALLAPQQTPLRRSASGDRLSFLGLNGSIYAPQGLQGDTPLDERYGANLDPCFAQQATWQVAAGASLEVVLLLGEATDLQEAEAFIAPYRKAGQAAATAAATTAFWQQRLGGGTGGDARGITQSAT
ncbi:MAG: hypothetical protein HQL49_09820 [Gammaproteobacteria bacterium]|nr:hypothetical protein [Gammaproteobacteria bacterium]